MTREMALRYITIAETAAEPNMLDVLVKIVSHKEIPRVIRERCILALRPLLTKTHNKITSKLIQLLQKPKLESSLKVLIYHVLLEQPTPSTINAIVHRLVKTEDSLFSKRYIYERLLALSTQNAVPKKT